MPSSAHPSRHLQRTNPSPPPSAEAEYISLSTLNRHLQDELASLATLTSHMQSALTPAFSGVASLSSADQRKLQAIDRVQQTLDDLQRVVGHLATQNLDHLIPTAPLREVIRLRHLTHKLFDDIPNSLANPPEDTGEIEWL